MRLKVATTACIIRIFLYYLIYYNLYVDFNLYVDMF